MLSEEQRMKQLFEHFSREEMRIMWDNVGDNSYFGPYDCADIHKWMTDHGDGDYCAV